VIYALDSQASEPPISGRLMGFSPDSRHVAILRPGLGNDAGLFLVDFRGRSEARITGNGLAEFKGFAKGGALLVDVDDEFKAGYTVYQTDPIKVRRRGSDPLEAVSPDGGKLLVSRGGPERYVVVDTETGADLVTFARDSGAGRPEFSREGKYIVTDEYSKVAGSMKAIYSAGSGRLVFARALPFTRGLYGGMESVNLAFTESDRTVLTVAQGKGQTTFFHDVLGAKDSFEMACETMPRNPNSVEWKKYFSGLGEYRKVCPNLK
jgi:hypothetical protein